MQNSIIIFGTAIITLGLMAVSFINWNDSDTDRVETLVSGDVASISQSIMNPKKKASSDFIYDLGPRFGPIKKGVLDSAKSFSDFIDEKEAQQIVSYKSLTVIMIKDDEQTEIRERGYSDKLTPAQLDLLRSSNFSTHFLIRAEYMQKNKKTGELEENYSTPHLTIVPEKQAEYVNGKQALVEYLQEGIKEYTAFLQPDQLQSAKLYFTVTKKGTIENIRVDRTSNFPEIDKKIIEMIRIVPGEWEPAENLKGEKVDQEVVISYGLRGC